LATSLAGPLIIAPQFFVSLAREGGQARPLVWGSVLTLELAKP
jgi:hypothetical protein